jgi:hypothetical protein
MFRSAAIAALLASIAGCLTAAGPEPPGWYAGDPHVHRDCGNEPRPLTPRQLLDGMNANNLAVISVLGDMGNGEVRYQSEDMPLITGRDHPISTPGRIVHWDAEWHFDPKGVTFDQKVMGGHLILLGLRHGERKFAEYTYPIFEWAHAQRAIAGFAHLQYLPGSIPKVLDCCLPLEYPVETALGSVQFLMEDVNGSDTAIDAYYRLLNCGFRPALVAATDFPCNHSEPFGTLLTYADVRGRALTYGRWVEGIARGRTVVSRNAHNEFLQIAVAGSAAPGDELSLKVPKALPVEVRWSVAMPLQGAVELVQDGKVVRRWGASATPDTPGVFRTSIDFVNSGWICARRMDAKGHQVQTGAVFVIVRKRPVRPSVADPQYFVEFIDNLLLRTSPGGEWNQYFSHDLDKAQARYRQAREVYRKIAMEAGEQER